MSSTAYSKLFFTVCSQEQNLTLTDVNEAGGRGGVWKQMLLDLIADVAPLWSKLRLASAAGPAFFPCKCVQQHNYD
jgi:hypothetical protein